MSASDRSAPARVAVIAVGNELRGDDGVCLRAARRLRERGIEVRVLVDDMLALLDVWAGADVAVVLDAVRTRSSPGTIVRVEIGKERSFSDTPLASTHALGLGQTIELARTLGRLPRRVIVYGVAGARFEIGEDLSPPVEGAVEPLAAAVALEIEVLHRAGSGAGAR